MNHAKPILVLQTTGPDAALLRLHRGADKSFEVETLGTWRAALRGRDDDAISDAAVIQELGQCVRANKLSGRHVRVLLGGRGIACHRIAMPPLPIDAARKAIRLKLANLLPYDVAQAALAIDPPVTRGTESNYRVVSAPAEAVRSACQAVQNAGLIVEDLYAAPTAVETLLATQLSGKDELPAAAAFIGESGTTLVICHQGVVVAVNELPPALADLTAALMRPIIAGDKSITLAEAEARALRDVAGIPAIGSTIDSIGVPAERVLPLLEPVLQQWARAFTQWLTFAATSEVKADISRLVIAGPGHVTPGLAAALNGRLPVPVEFDGPVIQPVRMHARPGPTAPPLSDVQRAALAPAVFAAMTRFNLPSLLPESMRRTRRTQSRLRIGGLAGTGIAAACIVATAGLWRMGGGLSQTLAANENAMQGTRQRLSDLRTLLDEAKRINRLKLQLDTFSQCTPNWSALLKELARVLPPPIVLRDLHAERKDDSFTLQLTARVFCGPGESFDKLMREPLRDLQTSGFFEQVEVISARQPNAQAGIDAAELRLRMQIVYPTTLQYAHAPGAVSAMPPATRTAGD